MADRLSVLLICYSYPPVLGGSEIEAQRICAGLIKRGHRIRVFCAGAPPMPDTFDWTDPYGVPVRIFGRGTKAPVRDYLFAGGAAWNLWRERETYEVVYFLMQGLHLAAGLPVARALGKPVVMKISGSSIITLMRESFLGRLELRWLQKWSHRVMILNDGMRKEALDAGFRPDHLAWMPNPVDTEEFSPASAEQRLALRHRAEIAEEAPVVVYVGRLAPEKELDSLVAAFAAVTRQRPEAHLILVGDGPERESLEARVKECGIASNVRFTGRQSTEEVRDWLRLADAFALVSSNEGFSCSLAEAMSTGLAAVVSNIPANLQLIDGGVHGLHAGVRDEESIAAALATLLADGARRVEMGDAARRRVIENYSLDIVLDRYEALFREAIGRRA